MFPHQEESHTNINMDRKDWEIKVISRNKCPFTASGDRGGSWVPRCGGLEIKAGTPSGWAYPPTGLERCRIIDRVVCEKIYSLTKLFKSIEKLSNKLAKLTRQPK